ncbi:YeiH family protein [Taibaiella soli]|uniref:Putative sulfate exporter family transporter n=1 Tax=Taibaiella soli TaxID=1649169 RepID=A0A2W2AFQ0_9BACT|nr:putative sulfate exporter family transporter [Taibaiella soli]PZF74131.1 putative sulfate exporter family transporter [Taibaiella soli]
MQVSTHNTETPGLLKIGNNTRKIIFIIAAVLCLTPWVSAPIALLAGIIFANTIGHPFAQLNSKATKILLQVSVVGLGFGMNVHSAIQAGKEGILFTICSIFGTLTLGFLLGKLLKIDRKTSQLISSGTAICGGSAIAAIAPVINADEKQMSVALGTVFILNSIALFLFPAIGHGLHLSEQQFGLWAAIAIHDTSSVVGAASKYGPHALEVATTVKLARALWIIPLSLGTALVFKSGSGKIKIPWFIGYFILAMICNTYFAPTAIISPYIVAIAKAGLTLTLFLIGCGLSVQKLKSVGVRPLIQGVLLWIFISVLALSAVMLVG